VQVAGVLAEPVLKPTAPEPKAFSGNVEREGEGRHHTLSFVRRGRPAVRSLPSRTRPFRWDEDAENIQSILLPV
jgi:hypothetical protein